MYRILIFRKLNDVLNVILEFFMERKNIFKKIEKTYLWSPRNVRLLCASLTHSLNLCQEVASCDTKNVRLSPKRTGFRFLSWLSLAVWLRANLTLQDNFPIVEQVVLDDAPEFLPLEFYVLFSKSRCSLITWCTYHCIPTLYN